MEEWKCCKNSVLMYEIIQNSFYNFIILFLTKRLPRKTNEEERNIYLQRKLTKCPFLNK